MPDMTDKMKAVQEWREAFSRLPCSTVGEQELLYEIHAEISDPDYMHLRHGERHTRNKGCTGPLCKKALRDWQRERLVQHHEARGTTPRTYRRSMEMVYVDILLEPIKAAHDIEFNSRRQMTSEELQAAEIMNQLVA